MADPNKPASGSPTAGDGTEKKKRTVPPRIPPGHKQVKFFLPDAEHDQLAKLAEDDDRKPDDLARIHIRRHIRSSNAAAAAPQPGSQSR
jgi:hypothetical protein